MKVEIIGEPARRDGKVVGTVRFTDEENSKAQEMGFEEDLSVIASMSTPEELQRHLLEVLKPVLEQAVIEDQWVKAQAVMAPLVVKAEAAPAEQA